MTCKEYTCRTKHLQKYLFAVVGMRFSEKDVMMDAGCVTRCGHAHGLQMAWRVVVESHSAPQRLCAPDLPLNTSSMHVHVRLFCHQPLHEMFVF